ncbi:hypothetical protein EJB05_47606 [Eragrostis curvula]|uniref:rRNA N-glycosylase n=1 Tax=Eragrostis curvula TaxID=38414 RepID=A0A5J9SZP8_9POAL|nr:hypothetical protein EJB05_47606 [Eragrostis curvula]
MACNKFLSLVLIIISVVPVALGRETNIQFSATSEDHQQLYDVVKAVLSDYKPIMEVLPENEPGMDVKTHLVLRPQRSKLKSAPKDPIHLKLKGLYNDETTLYIAPDNLYVYGFMNKSGTWHMMHTVPLGRQSMLHAIHIGSWYNPHIGDPVIHKKQVQLFMSRMTMMISESLRFHVIRESFANAWDGESFATKEDCLILHQWGALSRFLMDLHFKGEWPDKKVKDVTNIKSKEEARKKVDVLVRPAEYDLM